MAEDIVTRLRDAEDNGISEWQVLIDAADEIERLRRLGDALAEDSWNNRSADEAVKAWWEARNA